ncbi:phasin family protein [Duganella sp. BJB488]|uniref:phasin family protein n=1 Tax=unclassified Duganella TaxID=2636909 RepID=UPI000E343B04|nr:MULTISPECIES: phasin family protein [unclassified Duganella]RFP26089.1 phasin family protein [Duganella sp. BJB489]RFP28172.1 phasin family protein [Duganella sp. BJB488]RFP37020.1 phasin family protein [Duganella sp. BJB480]
MSSITEQFSAATKSQLEAQFKIFNTFASTAVESAEKVIALNISTTKASVEKSSAAAKKLLGAKDPREFFSLSTAEPASFDNLLAYGRELYSIASGVQNELIQSAQSTIKQVSDLAAAPVTALKAGVKAVAPAAAPVAAAPAVAAPKPAAAAPVVVEPPVVVTTAAANEPVATPEAKPAKAAVKPKAEEAPVQEEPKAAAKPSFPAPPAKPVAADSKPELKSVPSAKAKPTGKQLDMLGSKTKK